MVQCATCETEAEGWHGSPLMCPRGWFQMGLYRAGRTYGENRSGVMCCSLVCAQEWLFRAVHEELAHDRALPFAPVLPAVTVAALPVWSARDFLESDGTERIEVTAELGRSRPLSPWRRLRSVKA